jgi:hypothetical protein
MNSDKVVTNQDVEYWKKRYEDLKEKVKKAHFCPEHERKYERYDDALEGTLFGCPECKK